MKKIGFALALLLLLAGSASAQDWQEDAENNTRYDCDLARAMIAAYGDQDLLQLDSGSTVTLEAFLNAQFPRCLESLSAETDADAGPEEAMPLATTLQTGEMIAFRDYCTLLVTHDDEAEQNRVFIGGGDHELISVDLYLPDADEALAVEATAIEDLMGLPLRIETFGDTEFPPGLYTFDVHVEDDSYRFQWLRDDLENAAWMVSCVGQDGPVILPQIREMMAAESAEAEAADPPGAEPEATRAVDGVLEYDDVHLLDADCFVLVTGRFDADANVTITGSGQDEMSVDVYPPGASEPLAVLGIDHDVLESDIPLRIEWLEDDELPLGVYTFDAHIGDDSHRFEWNREEDSPFTFVLSCIRLGDFEESLDFIEDGGFVSIDDAGCGLWTDEFEQDLNVIVSAPDPESIEVDLYFPRESHPEVMDGVQRDEFDDGTKYRAEWIIGDSFPLGGYTIIVHLDGRSHSIGWDRQDDAYNSIFIYCEGGEDES